jgi:drug/metabolite transporter (DMT)-like permease
MLMQLPWHDGAVRSSGTAMCIASAACFGAMAIFGKLAYDAGATVGTLLAVRFLIAAAIFWVMVAAAGTLPEVRALGSRDLRIGLGLGAFGYAAQAGFFFSALERIDASLLSLVLYTFPSIVAAAAVALGRERMTRRRLLALVLASAGLALVVGGAGAGSLDALGVALGLGAALVYSTYILVSQGISGRLRPTVLSALVCTGAAVSLTAGSGLLGELHPDDVTVGGWASLAGIAVVSTVGAVSLFFAGLSRVGPTAASILSTVEPLVTVVLALIVFGEVLGLVQIAGGVLVLAAVLVLNARRAGPPATAPVEDPATVRATA